MPDSIEIWLLYNYQVASDSKIMVAWRVDPTWLIFWVENRSNYRYTVWGYWIFLKSNRSFILLVLLYWEIFLHVLRGWQACIIYWIYFLIIMYPWLPFIFIRWYRTIGNYLDYWRSILPKRDFLWPFIWFYPGNIYGRWMIMMIQIPRLF